MLRHIFERVVWAAMATGVVKGEGFAADATVHEANANRYHGKAPAELGWWEQQRQTRAVTEYLVAPYEAAKPNPDRKGAEGDLAVRPLFGLDGQLPSVGSVCR